MLALVLAVLAGAWLYVRSSSLVAIRQVRVTGVSGADAGAVRAAVVNASLTMTTLDLSVAKLRAALARYPHITGIAVQTHFPHGVTVHVEEEIPVAAVHAGGRLTAVDGAGRLLPREPTAGLVSLPIAPDTGGARVTAAGTLAVLTVLAAAPYRILPHVQSARSTTHHGVTVTLRDGPTLYFGDTTQARLKWSAAVAVLAHPASRGASYIDVSAPQNPAAGSA
ncbi:MAG TPA: FtsQ-type POTRA domain-containing protein [Solirubrobacteraceae bacterium]|nr:FtsQ-type POTRA domain-containing protein [Solirubrobacteraceae bacterium]